MTPQALPVSIQTNMLNNEFAKIYYPQVIGLNNKNIEHFINETIFNLVNYLVQQQYEQQGTNAFIEMIGTFEIKTNERNILSLSLANYAYAYEHAHGLTLMKSLTFNIQTGKQYELADLFKQGSNYVEVLSKKIHEQISERDIPILNDFSTISPNQDFYIADKSLVIYFQLYEITPYYIGIPMFPISVYTLENIAVENGPLDIMATNN